MTKKQLTRLFIVIVTAAAIVFVPYLVGCIVDPDEKLISGRYLIGMIISIMVLSVSIMLYYLFGILPLTVGELTVTLPVGIPGREYTIVNNSEVNL